MFDEALAPNGALLFDNSTIEKLKCAKLAEYSWLRKRELVASKAGRNFGSGLHCGWATRYELCLNRAPNIEQQAAINDSMAKWFEAHPQPVNDFRNFNHACKVMNAYNANYSNEPWKIVTNPKDNKPIIEASFCLPFDFEIDGHPVYYTGKIDTAIEDMDGLWSFDHKSAFQFGDAWNLQMQMDGGQIGYFWALWQTLGIRPKGYIIDGVRIRRPTKGKLKEYMEIDTAPVDGTDFMRIPVPLPFDDQIESWKEDVKQLIGLFVQFHKAGRFPRQRWNCTNKFGKCDMIEVCSCPLAQQDAILYNTPMFEESTWSPLRKTTKQESK